MKYLIGILLLLIATTTIAHDIHERSSIHRLWLCGEVIRMGLLTRSGDKLEVTKESYKHNKDYDKFIKRIQAEDPVIINYGLYGECIEV